MLPLALVLFVGTSPLPRPLPISSALIDKNFYFLSLLERTPAFQKAWREEPHGRQIQEQMRDRLRVAFQDSSFDQSAEIRSMLITDAETSQIADILKRLVGMNPMLRRAIVPPLRESGTAILWHALSDEDLVAKVWAECAAGINNAILVYGTGKSGRSAKIDSMFYDPKAPIWNATVHNLFGILVEESKPTDPFFAPSLRFAANLMEFNRRDEAARFEPMEKGENRAAFRTVRRTKWEKFPYSVILVPGLGPEEPEVALSPAAKLILGAVARRYCEGKAPFILVSGGYVHPNQTPFCEAIEMKRSLMRDFAVPESAILIDPHARHTTTNLRNAARILYRYGFPFSRPGLITTNTYQSQDIASPAFVRRCQNTFGYQPFEAGKRLSPFDLEFFPKIESLQIDPQDPLDP